MFRHAALILFLLYGALPLLAYDSIEENTVLLKGIIGAVREDFLSVSRSSDTAASQVETAFFRREGIELINLDHWHQLKEGLEIVLRYKEKLLVHEGKDKRGGTFRESKVLSREIISIEAAEVPETAAETPRQPTMLKS